MPKVQKLPEEQKIQDFNAFVGSETGFLKGVNFNEKSIITKNFSKDSQTKGQNVASLFWSDINTETEIVVGFENQKICTFDTSSNCYVNGQTCNLGEGPLVSAFEKSGKIVAGIKTGEIGILNEDEPIIFNTSPREYSDRYTKKATLTCVKPNVAHPSQIATGGCENDLAIWDIENTTAPVFRAKNVKADMLELRVPVWISDLAYLQGNKIIATVSRHKHVRLYDPDRQRRPTVSFEWEDHPLTCVSAVPSCDKQIVVGANHGRMALFDFRSSAKTVTPVHVFKDFLGSTQSVSVHESLPLVFSVSLDRFAKVHHLGSGKLIHRQYLKSRLSSILVRKDVSRQDFSLAEEETETYVEKGVKRSKVA